MTTDIPHTPAIPAGMKAWHGGDSAPEDWDGGPVLLRDGDRHSGYIDWEHAPDEWSQPERDVIAYTPRPQPAAAPSAEVER